MALESEQNMNDEFQELDLRRPESLSQLIDDITPQIYQNLKTAVELGKWEDGARLSSEQLESCLQAVILYEARNVPEQQRTGFDLSADCSSKQTAQTDTAEIDATPIDRETVIPLELSDRNKH